MILSGYVPTPVPGPTEVPTRVPGPVVVATEVPGPTIVATPMPFWLRPITGILQAEAEIQVQVVGVTMDAAEALRGQGLLSAVISSMDLAPAAQFLRGQAAIRAVIAGGREVEYPVHLEGRGEILASGVAMILSAGVRSLAGRGAVTAGGISTALQALVNLRGRGAVTAGGISTALQALVNLRGQGRVTASPTDMALTDPVARLLAGRGAITITGATQTLNTPTYAAAAAASATSVTLPEHQAGDFLLIVALSSVSFGTVQPTLPAGWTSVRADAGGTNSYGKATIGYRIAASGSEASGTWTNANTVIAVVCRGVTGIGATSYANAGNVGATPLARAAATVNASSRVLQVAHAGDWYVQATDIAAPSTSPATDLLAHTNTGAITRTEVWDSGGPVGSTTVTTSSQAITWSSATDYGVRSWMTWIIELTM